MACRHLTEMQVSDGGWGWFSGWGERSWPHTTATVVHGLQVAQAAGATVPPAMLDRGMAWLTQYQNEQLRLLGNAPAKTMPYKEKADNVDALVYMTLVDGGVTSDLMQDALYRDRGGGCTEQTLNRFLPTVITQKVLINWGST